MRVYVAGPMTKGRWEENTRRAVDAGAILIQNGFEPFIPHLYCLLDFVHPQHYERWMELDFSYIRVCEALLRIPGESSGADREIKYAEHRSIPVFYNVADLIAWRDDRLKTMRELASDIQRVESTQERGAGIIPSVGGPVHDGQRPEAPGQVP